MTAKESWVTACIPTYRCAPYLRSAVLSLLEQTHRSLRVIVINDGDPVSPWPDLADITDPRLIRYDLGENRGPYFCLAVALEATPDEFFLIQDADDLSVPHRVATLLRLLARDRSNFAFSALGQFHDGSDGDSVVHPPLFAAISDLQPGPDLRLRIPHHGLFQAEAVRRLGGYYGGFRFGYDLLLTNLLLLTGSASSTSEWLYWRRRRPTSLTRAPDTGLQSTARRLAEFEMADLYRQCYAEFVELTCRRLSGLDLLRSIRSRLLRRCGPVDARQIKVHAARLRRGIEIQASVIVHRY